MFQNGYYQIFKDGTDVNNLLELSGGSAVTRVEVSFKFLEADDDDDEFKRIKTKGRGRDKKTCL